MLNPVQDIAYKQIQSDAKFIASIVAIKNDRRFQSNYTTMLFPLIGLFSVGAEQWGHKVGMNTPVFTGEEKKHYDLIRSSHKIFELEYESLVNTLKESFDRSNAYFSGLCMPIIKQLQLYYNVGVDIFQSKYLGNTILTGCYVGDHFSSGFGEKLRELSVVSGELAGFYGASLADTYAIKQGVGFSTKDFHFFARCPLKRKDFDGFTLFSILCCTNYYLYFLDALFAEEFPAKLRFAYLHYYYLVTCIREINVTLGTYFSLDERWVNPTFRNCMAHYGMGQVMSESDIIASDMMGGLTHKVLSIDYYQLKSEIYSTLENISRQIEAYIF